MVKCDLCGQEFKNTQGLRGHKTFFHGLRKSDTEQLSAPAATQQQLSAKLTELEERLELTEDSGVELTGQLIELLPQSEQLKQLTEQVGRLGSGKVGNAQLAGLGKEVRAELLAVRVELGKLVKRGSVIAELARELRAHTLQDILTEQAGKPRARPMEELEQRLNKLAGEGG